jgi:ABC-type Fe3+/spermidine/putrescine transport system ATPase subunit
MTHQAPIRGQETSPSPREAEAGRPFVEVRGLVAAYAGKVAVHGVSFGVPVGSHLSLLGPSGCGKSTVLRCIAGLERPLEGEIVIDGTVVFSAARGVNLPPERRQLSMVFQSYAIWPHMTVFENVAYGLRLRGVRGHALREQVLQALGMVGLAEMADRSSTALSGGQQQRVALARAYAFTPKAVLLDEPLSNLDARLRVRMREELKDIQHQVGLTTLYVTHDQEEAMAISDRIIIMREGHIEQDGEPLEIYDAPRSRFVADFIGAANILEGRLSRHPQSGQPVLEVGEARVLCAPGAAPSPAADGRHLAAVRTAYPKLSRGKPDDKENSWPARIRRRSLLGDLVVYAVEWPGGEIRVQALPTDILAEGETVCLQIPPDRVVLVAG